MPTEDSLFSRRDIIRLSALLTATGALPFLNARAARAQDPDEPVRIGYLPITDATPLLVAHGKGMFEAEGLRLVAAVPDMLNGDTMGVLLLFAQD